MVKVLSVGGSIVSPPEGIDDAFITAFRDVVLDYLDADETRRLIFVVGGGGPARAYQTAYRAVVEEPDHAEQDWIGIAATRLNGQFLKAVFGPLAPHEVVTDPTAVDSFGGRILVAAGWKPGFSTDFDAVVLAERFGADTVVNLSNISKVYSADPKKDPNAVPLDSISWADFRAMVGDEWTPGKNVPFDPVATKKGAELGLKVITADGRDIHNLRELLEDRPFDGTVIGPT